MALSRAETLRRKRESERKRRLKTRRDPAFKAEENRKQRARYKKNTAKRELKKNNLSKREVRVLRKKWRDQKRNQKAKQQIPNEDGCEDEVREQTPLLSVQKKTADKLHRRKVAKAYYRVTELEAENEKLTLRAEKYRSKYRRLREKMNSTDSNSPRLKLNRELKNVNVTPDVRRRLLMGESLVQDLRTSYSAITSQNSRKTLLSILQLPHVKKYKFMTSGKPFYFLQKRRPDDSKEVLGERRQKFSLVRQHIREFFERDDISTLAPGKNECITRKGIKKQKRYLNNTLKYLFRKFCEVSELVVSYSMFCKIRPFWVVSRKVGERDTCLCQKHENMKLMVAQLKQVNIVNNGNVMTLLNDKLFCSPPKEDCYFRNCLACADKMIQFNEFESNDIVHYYRWESVIEKGDDGRPDYRRVVKHRKSCTKLELTKELEVEIVPFARHVGLIQHQFTHIDNLKANLDENELLIHIDFAENYILKYADEIQSVHFGGNRQQVTLHTGVQYKKGQKECFCTLTEDLRHEPIAIFSHLKPILSEHLDVKILHFLSDSPSSQYRNKTMFGIIYHIIRPLFPNLEFLTWNYSESGHGKGACDGVGATLKHTCDRLVASNHDIDTFERFMDCLNENIKNVKLLPISRSTMNEMYKQLQLDERLTNCPPIKGTMQCHQVRWMAGEDTMDFLYFNSMSCFECRRKECVHYHLTRHQYYNMERENDKEAQEFCSTKSRRLLIRKGQKNESKNVMKKAVIDIIDEPPTVQSRKCRNKASKMIPSIDKSQIRSKTSKYREEKSTETIEASTTGMNDQNLNVETSFKKTSDILNVDDWAVVQFPLEEQEGVRKFIGKILRIDEGNRYYITFVRSKSTIKHAGYIYNYPNIPDEMFCTQDQILYQIPAPDTFQRALKFSVHTKEL